MLPVNGDWTEHEEKTMETSESGSRPRNHVWFGVALTAWLVAVLGYWARLALYSNTAGPLGRPPELRQIGEPFGAYGETHLLVMALHPKCPCSRASIGELERLVARLHQQLTCVVLVYQPKAAPDDWLQTDLVDGVRRIPGVRWVVDSEGSLARRLNMETSGSTVLYSPAGDLEYWGGITASRGHAGDNLGSDAITAAVRGEEPPVASQPAFGCWLFPDRDPDGN
jgi:hypothetical protein